MSTGESQNFADFGLTDDADETLMSMWKKKEKLTTVDEEKKKRRPRSNVEEEEFKPESKTVKLKPSNKAVAQKAGSTSTKTNEPLDWMCNCFGKMNKATTYKCDVCNILRRVNPAMGSVCVMWREVDGVMDVEPFALQTSFFAIPYNEQSSVKTSVEAKQQEMKEKFTEEGYSSCVVNFDLPFEVGQVCKAGSGHSTQPKKMEKKAEPPSKKIKK